MSIFSVGGGNAAADYDIDQSLRFEDGDSAYLSRTPSSAGNRKTFTISFWLKPEKINESSSHGWWWTAKYANDWWDNIAFYQNKFQIENHHNGGTRSKLRTTQVFRDPSSWYHCLFYVDTTDSTSGDRLRIYINGERVTVFDVETYPGLNDDWVTNQSGSPIDIGRSTAYSTNNYADGYLAEVHFIDGQALTPASFGETDPVTNQWKPIEVTGMTYGTNGFYQKYSATELNNFVDSSSSSHTITANGDVTNTRAQKKIGSSSIKFDGSGDYLSLADSSDWNIFGSGNWTTETWVKLDNHSQAEHLFGQYASNTSKWEITHNGAGTNNGLSFGLKIGSGSGSWVIDSGYASSGSGEITDTDWHHVALVKNSNTYTMYLDGTALDNTVTDTDTDDISGSLYIGQNGGSGSYLTGYMDEIRISDTARYTSSFTPSTTAFTADSNTKLLIHSDFDGGLGADSSGNTNDFTPTNLVATDVLTDTPTNNGATWNPLANKVLGTTRYAKFTEGNRVTYQNSGASNTAATLMTMSIPNGAKKHVEFDMTTVNSGYPVIKITALEEYTTTYLVQQAGTGVYTGLASGASDFTYTSGDRITWEIDNAAGKIYMWKNGVAQNSANPAAGTGYTAEYTVPAEDIIIQTVGNTTSRIYLNSMEAEFDDSVTTGYSDFSTSSMDDPSIADPTVHFNTITYSGDGTSSRTITGVGFQPDLMWLKARNQGSYHRWHDSVRGDDGSRMYVLGSSLTAAESTDTSILSLASDGFTTDNNAGTGGGNASGDNYVSWNWKAGGTAVSNTDGSITSSVSANTTAGFSIVGYTGIDAAATVGHGLSQAPELIIIKSRGAASTSWAVGSGEMTSWAYSMELDTTDAEASVASRFNSTAPTSSVFSIGNSGYTGSSHESPFIAYCFHGVDGYSKVGSYEGNNNADGSFIYLGFKPEFFLVKDIDAVESWAIWDGTRESYNKLSKKISPDTSDAEYTANTTTYAIDFLSNGVKLRSSYSVLNAAQTYLYYAVASSPFKTSNAR